MSDDQKFAGRVRRLGAVSLVALGLVFLIWTVARPGGAIIGIALAAGWILMPASLFFSLRRPAARVGVAVPAVLVGAALIAICAWYLPSAPAARAGWLLVTVGVVLGGLMGAWFWFRLLPVPASLENPFSRGRWTFISIHVALIVCGLMLLGVSALT